MAKLTCAHCGRDINFGIDFADSDLRLNHISVRADLCYDCFNKLCGMVKKFVGDGK